MAEYKFALALNASDIPPMTSLQPRSIIVAGMDNVLRDPATGAQNTKGNNPQNLPQILYCENIMPIPEGGVKSVAFIKLQDAAAQEQFDGVYILRDETEQEWFFSPAHGYNYVVAVIGGGPWVSTNPRPGAPIGAKFSLAYVNGQTFICYANQYLGRWDGTTQQFVDVTASLVGVGIGSIKYITGNGNYLLLLCEDSSVKWSSLTDPLDFTPSEITGAGSQIPVDIRGAPASLSPMSGGFLIHCNHNVVAALYTNNSAQPWVFREVRNSGGIRWNSAFSRESSSGNIYALTTYGLQSIELRGAENVFPEVTDFLSGHIYETYNPVTKTLSMVPIGGSNFQVKVSWLLDRYVILSYGLPSPADTYFAAFAYDTLLKRWGKFNFEHVDVFSVRQSYVNDNVYFLKKNGEIYLAAMRYDETGTAASVLLLGRYQLNRTSQICSQELELEFLRATSGTDGVEVRVISNYNGSTVGEIQQMIRYESSDRYQRWQKQLEGENISYLIEGDFILTSAIATVTRGGRL